MKTEIQSLLVEKEIAYTGEQLRSHWAYDQFGLLGDSIVAFIGPCDVAREHMKDVEDLKAGSSIYSERMLHFIVEHFGCDLENGALRQLLLIALIAEELKQCVKAGDIKRVRSDIYDWARKVSVSISSVSPVSALIHAGVNISSRNTPVPTRGLDDFHVEPTEFARKILKSYADECAGVIRAQCKVRPCQ